MASTSTQPELESPLPHVITTVSRAHRCIDLGLVLSVAFAGDILISIYALLHPTAIQYSNGRLSWRILQEVIALLLFMVLFKRQGRHLREIGFVFRWTDLPKAFGLVFASFSVMWGMTIAVPYVYFLITLRTFNDIARPSGLSACSIWLLLPFLLLNPFFEELLVRGYLMTELIDLRKSVLLAAIVSLAVQTSYHLYYGVFGAAMVGCGLSVFVIYYAKSRRLMPVILAHMLWDLTSLLSRFHR